MSYSVSLQKIIRTGDAITSQGKKMVVHYIIEHDGQLSFESAISKIKEIIVCEDANTKHLKIGEFKIVEGNAYERAKQ